MAILPMKLWPQKAKLRLVQRWQRQTETGALPSRAPQRQRERPVRGLPLLRRGRRRLQRGKVGAEPSAVSCRKESLLMPESDWPQQKAKQPAPGVKRTQRETPLVLPLRKARLPAPGVKRTQRETPLVLPLRKARLPAQEVNLPQREMPPVPLPRKAMIRQ
jgi:hypothetical protein